MLAVDNGIIQSSQQLGIVRWREGIWGTLFIMVSIQQAIFKMKVG